MQKLDFALLGRLHHCQISNCHVSLDHLRPAPLSCAWLF